jgi:peptide methionine sulfoxide reductase msrA/msrB
MREIYFAGGCFWGAEHYLKQIRGVVDTDTGFANGRADIVSPTYEEVYTDQTGYAETVRVRYDEHIVGLRFLTRMFFRAIDPTSLNQQGEDRGTRYRTGVYFTDPADLSLLQEVFREVERTLDRPMQVELEPLRAYYSASDYHQDYLDQHQDGYCHLPLSLFKYAREAQPETD